MANSILTGSINLTDIPPEMIKTVMCRDGKQRSFLNVAIIARREPATFNNNGKPKTLTHFISCAPKKEERKDGVNYIIGDLETKVFPPQGQQPTQPYQPYQQMPAPNPGGFYPQGGNNNAPF